MKETRESEEMVLNFFQRKERELKEFVSKYWREHQVRVHSIPYSGWIVHFTYMPAGVNLPSKMGYWSVDWVRVNQL